MTYVNRLLYTLCTLLALSISACGGSKGSNPPEEQPSENNDPVLTNPIAPAPGTNDPVIENPQDEDPAISDPVDIIDPVVPLPIFPTPVIPEPVTPKPIDSDQVDTEHVLEKFVGVWDASENGDEYYLVVKSPEERENDASVYEYNYRGDQYEAEFGTYQNCYSEYPAGDMEQNENGVVELQGLEVTVTDNFLFAEPWGRLRRTQLLESDLAPTCTDEQELAYNFDIDGDGLPNMLELEIGLNQFQFDSDDNGVSDGDEDHDFDGISNFQEYLDGTLPECVNDGSRFEWDRNCEVSSENSNIALGSGYVRAIQGILWCYGYANGATTNEFIDGIYGPITEQAVSQYQSDNFLFDSGVVDSGTWSSLKQKIFQDFDAQSKYKACDKVVFDYGNQTWRIEIFYDNIGLIIPSEMTFR